MSDKIELIQRIVQDAQKRHRWKQFELEILIRNYGKSVSPYAIHKTREYLDDLALDNNERAKLVKLLGLDQASQRKLTNIFGVDGLKLLRKKGAEYVQAHKLGISYERFNRRDLRALMVNRLIAKYADFFDPRPLAVVINGVTDWNGAFIEGENYTFQRFMKHYRVLYYEVAKDTEFVSSCRQATVRRKASFGIFGGHGDQVSMALSAPDSAKKQKVQEERYIDTADGAKLKLLKACFKKDARIVHKSCSNAKGGKGADNLINFMAYIVPQAYFVGLKEDDGVQISLDQDGSFIGIRTGRSNVVVVNHSRQLYLDYYPGVEKWDYLEKKLIKPARASKEHLRKLLVHAKVHGVWKADNDFEKIVGDPNSPSFIPNLIRAYRNRRDLVTHLAARSLIITIVKFKPDERLLKLLRNEFEKASKKNQVMLIKLLAAVKDRNAVPLLVKNLVDSDLRKYAAKALVQIGDKSAVPLLIASYGIVQYKNKEGYRPTILEVLGELGQKSATPFLFGVVSDWILDEWSDDINSVYSPAMKALQKIKDPGLAKECIALFRQRQAYKYLYVRGSKRELDLIKLLGLLGDRSAVPEFAKLLVKVDKRTAVVVEALERIGGSRARAALELVYKKLVKECDSDDPHKRARAIDILVRGFGKRATVHLIDALGSSSPIVRSAALTGIRQLMDSRTISALRRFVYGLWKESDHRLRRRAMRNLALIVGKKAIPLFGAILKDKNESKWVRRYVIDCMEMIGGADAAQVLATVIQEVGVCRDIRDDILYALKKIGDKRVTPALVNMLKRKNNSPQEIVNILRVLRKIGDARALEPIEDLRFHRSSHVRFEADSALFVLKKRGIKANL